MVSYDEVKQANTQTFSGLPPSLVAVFIGATSGIGEYTLKQFAKHAQSPRVYFVGRSPEAGSRIESECSSLNPSGTFTFIKADTSLILNVDKVCTDIQAKEPSVNLLFLSMGTLDFYTDTSEGLRLAAALIHYGRLRLIQNLLPQLQAATSLKRVVSVFGGTKEGLFDINDINGDGLSLLKRRGHVTALVTMGMMTLAQRAPDVAFVHDYPGAVESGIGRDMQGWFGTLARTLGAVVGPLFYIPNEESGAYHLFFATNERYCSREANKQTEPTIESGGIARARGIDGVEGSGTYCIDQRGEPASPYVEKLLADYKQDGTVDKVWQHTVGEWKRILDSSRDDVGA